MWRLLLVPVVVLALAHSSVRGQEPTPVDSVPVELSLREMPAGGYRLEVRNGSAVAPYTVRATVVTIGTDHGVVITIAEGDQDQFVVDLDLPLDGMRAIDPRCYHVGFSVGPTDHTKEGAVESTASLDTRACVDAAGVVSFPAHDGVIVPPPAPPSDVRVVPGSDDTWRVEWTDNSTDEISFDTHINFLDSPLIDGSPGGNILASMELPEVPANQTTFGSLGFFFIPDGPPEPVCGVALVLVYAIGPDSSSYLPGTTQVPACFGRGVLSFPETGFGAAGPKPGTAVPHARVVLFIGGALLALGLLVRRTSMRHL